MPDLAERGLTPNEVAKLLLVSADKIRCWIRAGQLGAVNVGANFCGKPKFVILPHHLREFEKARAAAAPPRPRRWRRRRTMIDYFPDAPEGVNGGAE